MTINNSCTNITLHKYKLYNSNLNDKNDLPKTLPELSIPVLFPYHIYHLLIEPTPNLHPRRPQLHLSVPPKNKNIYANLKILISYFSLSDK